MLKKLLLLVIGVCLIGGATAWAAIPPTINFQGRITDSGGNPVAGNLALRFELGMLVTGWSSVWDSGDMTVPANSNGVFDVVLSGGTPALDTVDFSDPLFLRIYRDSVIVDTQPLASVPYAFHAAVADSLAGGGVAWESSSSDIYYNAGNVGIGTDSPINKLHIHASGTEPLSPWIRLTNDTTGGTFGDGTSVGLMPSGDFAIHNTEPDGKILLLTDGGNVGIDVIDPQAKLHVEGTAAGVLGTSATGMAVAGISATGYSGYFGPTLSPGSGATNRGVFIFNNNELEKAQLVLYQDSTGGQARLKFANGKTNVSSGNLTQDFWTIGGTCADSGSDAIMNFYYRYGTSLLDTKTALTLKGNGLVGIGTLNPQQDLHINAPGTNSPYIMLTNANFGSSGTDGLHIGLGGTSGNAFIMQKENKDLYFRTNNLNRITIKNDGKVGIGTTSPNSALHVKPMSALHNPFRVQDYSGDTAFCVYANEGAAIGANPSNVPAEGLYVKGYTKLGTGGSQTPHQIRTYCLENTFATGTFTKSYISTTLKDKTIYSASLMVKTGATDWHAPPDGGVKIRASDGEILASAGQPYYNGMDFRVFVVYGP